MKTTKDSLLVFVRFVPFKVKPATSHSEAEVR